LRLAISSAEEWDLAEQDEALCHGGDENADEIIGLIACLLQREASA
jgi:hypothetical protein